MQDFIIKAARVIVFLVIFILLIIIIFKILKLSEPSTSILFTAAFLSLLLIILVMPSGLKVGLKDWLIVEKKQLESDAPLEKKKENNIRK